MSKRVLGAALAAILAMPAAAQAATQTVTFTTAAEHTFTVPEGVTSIHVVAIGLDTTAPMDFALSRIMEFFRKVEGVYDNWTTVSHYSLSRLRVIEAMMLAIRCCRSVSVSTWRKRFPGWV